MITAIIKDSPADKAGLKKGDLITALGGVRLENSNNLSRRIAEAKIGVPLSVEYIRKRKTKTASVIIERLKEQVTEEQKAREKAEQDNAERVAMGISVEALTEETRKKYRVRDEVKGVRVVKVEKGVEASGKILTGDIIEEVGFESVTNPAEFKAAMDLALNGDTPVTILINRGGNHIFYALTI